MMASEFIAELRRLMMTHGDLEVINVEDESAEVEFNLNEDPGSSGPAFVVE